MTKMNTDDRWKVATAINTTLKDVPRLKRGVQKWIDKGVLVGSLDSFTFNESHVTALGADERAEFQQDFGYSLEEFEGGLNASLDGGIPAVMEFLRRRNVVDTPPLFRPAQLHAAAPWMTALEMQFAAMRWLNNNEHDRFPKLNKDLLSILRHSEAFSWSDTITSAVKLGAQTIPATSLLIPSMLPCRNAWWYFGINDVVPWEAISLSQDGTFDDGAPCLSITTFGPDADHFNDDATGLQYWPPIPSFQLRCRGDVSIGQIATDQPEHRDDASDHARLDSLVVMRFILAACVWIKQRIVVWSNGHVERHRRKQLSRENNAPPPSEVKVIQLRRTESASQPSGSESEAVDWSCRWVVNGHWRNQPYKDERKLIYIMPYVKGPKDKPLKVPTHTVYQVSR